MPRIDRDNATPMVSEIDEHPKRRVTHIIIPIAIWESDLPTRAKMLLAEIASLQDPNNGCFASNAYFAKFLQVTEIRVSQLLKELEEKKFIEYKSDKHNTRKKRSIFVKQDFEYSLFLSKQQPTRPPAVQKMIQAGKMRAAAKQDRMPSDSYKVVSYFTDSCSKHLGFTPTITGREYGFVKSLLKGHNEEELKNVIDFCMKSEKTKWQREHATLMNFLSSNTINQFRYSKSTISNARQFTGGSPVGNSKQYAGIGRKV